MVYRFEIDITDITFREGEKEIFLKRLEQGVKEALEFWGDFTIKEIPVQDVRT